MSNVLIGIIGVILFIGLALAGALFLGPRFQESTSNSKASATVQAMAQIKQASELYVLQEGKQVAVGGDLVSKGYLKVMPQSPIDGAEFGVSVNQGQVWVTLDVPESSRAVCLAINKQIRGISDIPVLDNPTSDVPTGCFEGMYGEGIIAYMR